MGIFLALEGPKGVGKTTVINSLRERLSDMQRHHVVLTKEPTATFDLAQETHVLGRDLARAIALDRTTHVAEVIRPALDMGKTVICDRYILSSLVFHSTDGVPVEEIWQLNQTFPRPSINLVLSAPASVIRSRRDMRTSLTRLEAATTAETEYDSYIHFGQMMQRDGSALQILRNETHSHLAEVLNWLMRIIEETTLA